MNRAELARRCGWTRPFVTVVLGSKNGKAQPVVGTETMERINEALGMGMVVVSERDINYLIGAVERWLPSKT